MKFIELVFNYNDCFVWLSVFTSEINAEMNLLMNLMISVCCRDGRLREGDQILAIDGQVLEAAISHQAAIGILQRARGIVDLVVARGLNRDISLIPQTAIFSPQEQQQQESSKTTSPEPDSGNLYNYLSFKSHYLFI